MSEKSKDYDAWSLEWTHFKKGNQESFRRIYDFFFDRLYRYGMKITSETELVEDCIQDLFLKLYSNRENLSETNQLEFYLLKSLKFTVYQKLRQQSKIQNQCLQLDSFDLELAVDAENSEEVNAARIQTVTATINKLTPAAKEILYLKFYSNLTYQEIGELMGIEPDSAKKQVYRIIKRLKETAGEKSLELLYMCFRA